MIPTHIAFIMDGNGRWAEKRHLPRKYGHKMGTEALKKVAKAADKCGIKFVTFYAFSTENWSRPQEEIDYLIDTFRKYLKDTAEFAKNNYRLVFVGNIGRFPLDIQEACASVSEETRDNTGLTVVIAMNYGSWEEITSAVNRLLSEKRTSVSEEDIRLSLYTNEIPFPDLVIRTGGERRLSNFLLLQSAYAELYFTTTLWPDFDKNELQKALDEYGARVRKFGGLGGNDVKA